MDSRCIPHTLTVTLGQGAALRYFVIEKAAERILEADIRGAAGAAGTAGMAGELTQSIYP